MKILLAFDSFKGSLSAAEVCAATAEGIRLVRPDVHLVERPMADGGEGTIDALEASLNGEWIPERVTGPLPDRIADAGYLWIEQTKTAVVEMAKASGLPLLTPSQYNPMLTTTYGTGELIARAVERGAKHIMLTVGGSATVDAGLGAASALGWIFLDKDGNELPPGGGAAEHLATIVPPACNTPAQALLEGRVTLDVLCDVQNPLCGPNGAAVVYGPQKGATPEMVQKLTSNHWKISEVVFQSLEKKIADFPGGGAAGGLAAGAVAFMNGEICSGIDAIMDAVGICEDLKNADWVLTGEGRFDSQSLQGKVVQGILNAAHPAGVHVGVIAGSIKLSESEWRAAGIEYAEQLQQPGMSLEETIEKSHDLLVHAGSDFAGIL